MEHEPLLSNTTDSSHDDKCDSSECICWGVRFFLCPSNNYRFYDHKRGVFYKLELMEGKLFSKSDYKCARLAIYDKDDFSYTICKLVSNEYDITLETALLWARLYIVKLEKKIFLGHDIKK